MIKLNINVTRIPRDKIKPGKNGKYVALVLFENKAGPDQYGNDGFVSMDVTKEEREAGQRGVIIGNWRDLSKSKPSERPAGGQSGGTTGGSSEAEDDDIPF